MSTVVAKKLFASALAAATISSFLVVPFVSHAAAHPAGTNVKSSDGTIWMVMPDGTRRAYTSAGAFLSYGFNSFGSVVAANADDLALPAGNFIPPQDGKVICSDRGADKGTCYLISGSMKAGFTSAAVFTGRGFSFARATKGDVSFLGTTANINDTTSANLTGVLINNGGTVQLRGATSNMGIPDLATFNSWGYSFADVVPANAADKAIVQAGIMAARQPGQLSPSTVANPGPGPGPVGPLSASLASSNPASGSIVAGQATANLLAFTVTGSGTLGSVSLMRSGISDQNTLTNVYLYDGATRLTDGYSFNSSSMLTMNNLGLIVNGSRTFWVKADVSASAASGQTIAVALTGLTAVGSTASTVSVMGNTMQVASGSTLATASLSANTVTGTPTVNAGTSAYVFWSAPLQVNTRTLQLKGANFRMVGSAPSDALSNIKMFIDGVDSGVAGVVTMSNGSNYVTFDFQNAPKNLTTGSHAMDVRADIQKGSNRNVTFSIQNASDLMILDPQVGVNIAVGGTIPNNAATIAIGTGSVTVVLDPAFQAMTNITGGGSNTTIAKFKLHGYGEDTKVQSLVVTPTVANVATTYVSGTTTLGAQTLTVASTAGFYAGDVITVAGATPGTATVNSITSGTVMAVTFTVAAVTPAGAVTNTTSHNNLDSVTLYFNGSQVGTQQNFTGTALTFQLGSQMIVPAGADSSLEVRANIRSTTGVNYTGGTISVSLPTGSSNAQGQSSFNTVNVPTATVTQPALTVQTGLLAVSVNTGYLNQNANPNTAGVKIGSFVLQNQSSSESVRVTSLKVDLSGSAAVTNFSALRTSETSGSGATPVQPQASNTFSVDFTLAPGATKTIDILADTSTATSVNVITTLTVTSLGVSSNVSTTSAAITGQTITLASGTVTNPPTLITASSTTAQYIAAGNGGATDATQAAYSFISTSGDSTITELKFTVTGSNTVTTVKVGSVSAPVVAGVAYLTGLNLVVPQSGGLTVNVLVSYSSVGTTGVTPGTTSAVALTFVKYTSGGTTTTITPSVSAPTMTMVGSKPVVTVSSTQQTGLNISGVTKVGEVTVTADPKGNIKLNDLVFTVSSSGFSTAPTAIGSPVISANNNSSNTVSGAVCTPASLVVTCEFGSSSNADFDGLQITPGSPVTLSLFGTLTGAAATGSGVPTISSSVGASTFNWDDTSTNGTSGTNLSGTLIYNFPNNSFSIKQ